MTKPAYPRGLIGFAIFNLVMGAMYLIAGIAALSGMSFVVAMFFGLSGTLMTLGSIGLLAGKRWAQRSLTLGLGAIVAMNGFISVLFVLLSIFGGPPETELFLVMIGYTLFTLFQAYSLWRIRRADVGAFMWEKVEAAIETAPHEVALDFGDGVDTAEQVEAAAEVRP